ncbi:hypothetical protein CC86DRAFT_460928 [Ophiobolus disseminans]|uniref:Uncharacterized protein n=1 Tax=Ophiobolus disseminans TaxID=1469910 RepID=A0A6A6ZCP2_9PLEO|nr:hypothetical protein CC86DRAFT_460928 [Ophiobolus disseminans]
MMQQPTDIRGDPRSARPTSASPSAQREDAHSYPSPIPANPPQYDFAALKRDHAGVKEGPFATAATASDSPLGSELYAAMHGYELPSWSTRQCIAAILLSFEDRSATKDDALQAMAKWPAVQKCVGTHDLQDILGLSGQDLVVNDLCAPGVHQLRSVAALLDRGALKSFGDFPLKGSLSARYHHYMELKREEQDPPGEPRPYDLDYGCSSWIEEFEEEFYGVGTVPGDVATLRNFTLQAHKGNCIFDKYIANWVAEKSRLLAAFLEVTREFADAVIPIFFGLNTFEIHESSRFSEERAMAHRWLEHMDKLGFLQHLRRLNVDMGMRVGGQTKWHIHCTFVAIVSMEWLQHLVITIDMSELWFGGDEFDEDHHFQYENAAPLPMQWSGVRMLAWAASAVPKTTHNAGRVLEVFMLHVRQVENIVKGWMSMDDETPEKFWSGADWKTPAGGWATPNIANAVALICDRQKAAQKWRSWDEGSEDLTRAVEFEISDEAARNIPPW